MLRVGDLRIPAACSGDESAHDRQTKAPDHSPRDGVAIMIVAEVSESGLEAYRLDGSTRRLGGRIGLRHIKD
ncbi:MAG TPA: hypothetical protein VFL95_02100 [Gemmatimonadales bacterium]|nr:hypothetical protein [Gemmatimonadales bacterium]